MLLIEITAEIPLIVQLVQDALADEQEVRIDIELVAPVDPPVTFKHVGIVTSIYVDTDQDEDNRWRDHVIINYTPTQDLPGYIKGSRKPKSFAVHLNKFAADYDLRNEGNALVIVNAA